ncbi:MAG TPA: type II toxin-antitoxin system prevent-host-death family antitoxin [Armatimonadota bacterium]|jgi:prevent-host-death family protein
MTEIGVLEARSQFSSLLERVLRGETIRITRHGRPVAILAPDPQTEIRSPRQAMDRINELRESGRFSLGDMTLEELIAESRGL